MKQTSEASRQFTADHRRIVGVVVTYGDRVHHCVDTVSAVVNEGVGDVIVVANGLRDQTYARLSSALQELGGQLRLIRLHHNSGSAGGFRVGLETALNEVAAWIWLLDDDNIPRRGSGKALRDAASKASPDVGALCSMRPSDRSYSEYVSGLRRPPPPGAYLHFDVWQRLSNLIPRRRAGVALELATAPYGGLLVRAAALRTCPLPYSELVLYEDDTLFTAGLRKGGYRLVPVLTSIIDDSDAKWSGSTKRVPILSSEHPERVYYGVRNRILYERSILSTRADWMRFHFNGALYVLLRLLFEAPRLRVTAASAFFRGIRDGRRERLGVHPLYRWEGLETELRALDSGWHPHDRPPS